MNNRRTVLVVAAMRRMQLWPAGIRRWLRFTGIALLTAVVLGPSCGEGSSPVGPVAPVATGATVRFVYRAATAREPDLPTECERNAGPTHLHVSWAHLECPRGPDGSSCMVAMGADRWEITISNVPTNVRHKIVLTDPNLCVENPPFGAATRRVFANDVRLVDVVLGGDPGLIFPNTPGPREEICSVGCLAFAVAPDGQVTP